MLEVEERLRLPVTHLLLEVRLHRVAPIVPDGRRGAEADGVVAVLEPPAEVDVVPGGGEDRLEAADILERLLGERHVAAGNVLRDLVVQEDVRRPPG